MERKLANNDFKWDLTDIYKSDEEWQKNFDFLQKEVKILATFKGKLNKKEELKDFNALSEVYSRILNKLYLYTFLNHDINLKESKYNEQRSMIEDLEASIASDTSYFTPELASLDEEYLKSLIDDPEFKLHKMEYESILTNKQHILSEKEENLSSLMNSFSGGFSNIFDALTESDMTFEPIIDGENTLKLTGENYGFYLTNSNREIRRQAYENLYKSYKQFSNTISNIYIYNVKQNSFDLKLRKYDSLLQASLQGNKIPERVYYNLIENVDKNVHLMHKYFELLKQKTKIEDFKFYDTYLSISGQNKRQFSVEEQFSIIEKALAVLGEDYIKNLQLAKEQHWIDAYSDENKAGGGYNIAIYDSHPYILLNDNGNYNSMSTMAHELGHAMHSFYSNKNQPSELAHYSIFVAEVASTVNEILLSKYMLKNCTDDEEKIFYLDQFIKNIKATVFRQTMFSEFEDFAHKTIENGKPLSLEILCNEYKKLNEKHFGNVVEIDDNIIYEWQRISHFYRPYYVYKYATSFTTAVCIASKILSGDNVALENYKRLLSSGGSDWPNELLKNVGIDLTCNEPYDVLFKELNSSLSELESLLNKKN